MEKINHVPVLLKEAIDSIRLIDNGIFIDATFGAGGYSREILKRNSTVKVIAFDRDASVKRFADDLKSQYKDRFLFINDNFSRICDYVTCNVNGVVFDIGISSMQIDNPERGFSYIKNGPLDMRMDNKEKLTAKDVINKFSETDLSDIFYNYGEEKKSSYIARKIVNYRKTKPLNTTFDLVQIISSSVSDNYRISSIKKIFQALRIYINDELNELQYALNSVSKIIKSSGVLSVVSFHSLEDRIVKNFFMNKKDIFKKIQKKIIMPTKNEIQNNSRSSSAKLRYAEKI